MCWTGPFEFRRLKEYIHNPSSYHHQIGSIHLSHCCHIFPWLCVWDGCTIIFCRLLHIYPGNTGTLFPLLMFSLWYLQTIGYIMACRSCSFVCRPHHLIIIIMQTYLKAAAVCLTMFLWKYFSRHWPFVRGIHRSPVNSPHKGQWRGALVFSLICSMTSL